MSIIIILCAFLHLYAADDGHGILPASHRFYRNDATCKDHFKHVIPISEDGRSTRQVTLRHNEKDDFGSVSIHGHNEFFFIKTKYSTRASETSSSKIFYYSTLTGGVTAKVDDLVSDEGRETHVMFTPPNLPSIDWEIRPVHSERPNLYWLCAYNHEHLQFTRFLFASQNNPELAYYFSLEVPLRTLSQGQLSWGTVSLTSSDIFYLEMPLLGLSQGQLSWDTIRLTNNDIINPASCRNFDYSRDLLWHNPLEE